MGIRCTNCRHEEKPTIELFVKIIGGAMPVGGFWAWASYLFAGTGLAMPIVLAIIGGGTAMLIFKDQIVTWLSNKGYRCPSCGQSTWG